MIGNRKFLIAIEVKAHRQALPAMTDAALATGHDVLVLDTGEDGANSDYIIHSRFRHVHLAKTTGKGEVLRQAVQHADEGGYDGIVTVDCDARHNPRGIALLIAAAESRDVPCLILGTPLTAETNKPWAKRMGKAVTSFLVRLECGLEVPDARSTFRLYPVQELCAQKLCRNGCSLPIESVVKFAWSGIPVFSIVVPGICLTPGDEPGRHKGKVSHFLQLISLHSRLLSRRLMPWPYKKLRDEPPFPEKVRETISQNPFKVLGKICTEHTSPLWLAMAVWLGIFMGALPLLAVHTIAIIYVAHKLHLNKVAAVAASQFCMPPVMPVLCIQVGYYFRNGEFLVDFSWQPWLLGIHERLWEWLLGSLVLGPLFGLLGAFIMYWMTSRLQKRRTMPLSSKN